MESPHALYPFPRMSSTHGASSSGTRAADSQSLVNRRNNLSSLSLISRFSVTNRATTLEVYDLVYGNSATEVPMETVERLYESNAGAYENPLITASSRQVIANINTLTHQLAQLDVPRPLAMFKTLFRPHSSGEASEPWFQALRVWSDIEDICDSESFDGHHLSIIEHTLNILILPGLHTDSRGTENTYSDALNASTTSLAGLSANTYHGPTSQPFLALPGLRGLPLPSPLHLKLHVLTRLSFNEAGRITRHRDFWDVRDVLGLVPGMQVAQWIGTRVTAHGLSLASQITSWMFGLGRKSGGARDDADMERGEGMLSPTASNSSSRGDVRAGQDGTVNALELHLEGGGGSGGPSRTARAELKGGPGVWGSGLYMTPAKQRAGSGGGGTRAPDVDRDDAGS